MTGSLWSIEITVPAEFAEIFSTALEPFASGLVASEAEGTGGADWRLQAFCTGMPDRAALAARLAVAALAAGVREPDLHCAPLPEIDWLAENRASFKPLRIGRFFLHPSHFDGVAPPGSVAICMDVATAFGSGEHPSTAGCLKALDGLSRRSAGRRPRRPLDLGCGSGILAIAMAKAWHARVTASDIDPEAVRVARENAELNGVADRVRVHCADGLLDVRLRRAGPYDLVVANILARPLARMARAVSNVAAPQARLVLSGLLREQEPIVRNAYRRHGFRLTGRLPDGEWVTLTMQR